MRAIGDRAIPLLNEAHQLLLSARIVAAPPPSDRWYNLLKEFAQGSAGDQGATGNAATDTSVDRLSKSVLNTAAMFLTVEAANIEGQACLLAPSDARIERIETIAIEVGEMVDMLLNHIDNWEGFEVSSAIHQLIPAYERLVAANPDMPEPDLARAVYHLLKLSSSIARADWSVEAVPVGRSDLHLASASESMPVPPLTLDDTSNENELFGPSLEFTKQANATSGLYKKAREDPDEFWATQASRLHWDTPWKQVLDWSNAPFARWFVDGKLNVAYNCVDRHVNSGHGDQVAFYWEGEPGDSRIITYAELQDKVCQAANALTSLGLRVDDRVLIYLPTLPEAIFSMLACARLGVIHNVTFSGFSADHLLEQIVATGASLVITSDGQYRHGKSHPMKDIVDQAVARAPSVRHVLVVRRTETKVNWTKARDHWWHDLVNRQSRVHTPESFGSEHPLFILATSGSTGSPKNIVHTSGGYLTQAAYTHFFVFDLKSDRDVYWCTADTAWITGHSYIVYGPLANRATQVIYEGKPDFPHKGRHWEIVEKYKVSIYYDAPTLIRTFMSWGESIPKRYTRESLRVLGSVGEPINPEAWKWYHKHIGDNQCPIVDTWWQTETGAIMIAPLPGVTITKPGSVMTPLPGISAKVVDDAGGEVPHGCNGYLVVDAPWPSMPRCIWDKQGYDEEGYKNTYWSRFAGKYYAGDAAKYDNDGNIWLLGREEDIINVSGHRIYSAEVESALVSHPAVAEAAVVAAGDSTQSYHSIVAFVILRAGKTEEENIAEKLRAHVDKRIDPLATPRQIVILPELPKTRSGKIQRRLLRELAQSGDVTALTGSTAKDLIDAL